MRKKLVVQLNDDLLLALGVVDTSCTLANAGIEFLQGVRFLGQVMLVERVQHALHGLRHRVVAGKAVFLKQGIEYRLCHKMLSEHFDYLAVTDAVVKIIAQLGGEGVEGSLFLGVGRVFQDALDAVDMGAGDLGNVVGPVFPVVAVAALLDDLGVDGFLDFTHFVSQLGLLG